MFRYSCGFEVKGAKDPILHFDFCGKPTEFNLFFSTFALLVLTSVLAQLKRFLPLREMFMADENEVIASGDATETKTPAPAAEPKKQRAPRGQKKASSAAIAEPAAKMAKPARQPRKKRGELTNSTASSAPSDVAAAASSASAPVARGSRKAKAVTASKPKAKATAVAGDEFSELLQLEEENKQLRKALSEKLRSENSDLRKKLGL